MNATSSATPSHTPDVLPVSKGMSVPLTFFMKYDRFELLSISRPCTRVVGIDGATCARPDAQEDRRWQTLYSNRFSREAETL